MMLEYIGSEYKNCAQSIAIDMGIESLKQESVLDKIEKEINSPNRGTCDYYIIDRIEEIINEYKTGRKE